MLMDRCLERSLLTAVLSVSWGASRCPPNLPLPPRTLAGWLARLRGGASAHQEG